MRAGRSIVLFALVALTLFAANVARADVYGRIRGTVTDPNGAIIPKAKVVAINTGTGITTTTYSSITNSRTKPTLPSRLFFKI